MNDDRQPKMGAPVLLKNVNRQPASLAVSMIMSASKAPERFRSNAALALTPVKAQADLWSMHACILSVDDRGEINDDFEAEAGCHFSGSKEQIDDVIRHLVAENYAGKFMASELDLGSALTRKKQALPKKSEYWHLPLVLTGDQRLLAAVDLDKDDPHAKKGPSFDYYGQDWQTTIEKNYARFDMPHERTVLDLAAKLNFKTVYPGQFVATRQRMHYDPQKKIVLSKQELKKDVRDLEPMDMWDVSINEPYGSRYCMTLGSIEYACTALWLMDQMFQRNHLNEDIKQYALRRFNDNHYSIGLNTPSKTESHMSRIQAYSKLLGNQSLS